MTTYALDANALIANMKPKASTLEEAIDYATACALVTYSRQEAAGNFRVGDCIAVGPHAFVLDKVQQIEGLDDLMYRWRKTGDDFVVSVMLSPDESNALRIGDDPHLYEVKDGRLACYEPA